MYTDAFEVRDRVPAHKPAEERIRSQEDLNCERGEVHVASWTTRGGGNEIRIYASLLTTICYWLHGMNGKQPCLITNALGPPGALWECQVVDPMKVSGKQVSSHLALLCLFGGFCFDA